MYILISHVLYVSLISLADSEIEVINKFIIYNSKVTQPWVALYKEKTRKWDSDRKGFKWLNGRSEPYPDHLKQNMPMIFLNSWVVDQVREKYGAFGHFLHAEEDVLNIGIGCNNSVINSCYTFLTS